MLSGTSEQSMMYCVARSNSSESRQRPSGSWLRMSFFISIFSSKYNEDFQKGSLPSNKFMAKVMVVLCKCGLRCHMNEFANILIELHMKKVTDEHSSLLEQ